MSFCGIRLFFVFCAGMILCSCQDVSTIADTNQEIPGRNWSYVNRIKIPVTVTDQNQAYNIYVNLRHTADYKYSNIFLKVNLKDPSGKLSSERKEFKLALPDGEWLGKGSGNLYSYQLPYKGKFLFPRKGTYIFELEQNMRDNPLKEITDAGLRVEKAD